MICKMELLSITLDVPFGIRSFIFVSFFFPQLRLIPRGKMENNKGSESTINNKRKNERKKKKIQVKNCQMVKRCKKNQKVSTASVSSIKIVHFNSFHFCLCLCVKNFSISRNSTWLAFKRIFQRKKKYKTIDIYSIMKQENKMKTIFMRSMLCIFFSLSEKVSRNKKKNSFNENIKKRFNCYQIICCFH